MVSERKDPPCSTLLHLHVPLVLPDPSQITALSLGYLMEAVRPWHKVGGSFRSRASPAPQSTSKYQVNWQSVLASSTSAFQASVTRLQQDLLDLLSEFCCRFSLVGGGVYDRSYWHFHKLCNPPLSPKKTEKRERKSEKTWIHFSFFFPRFVLCWTQQEKMQIF